MRKSQDLAVRPTRLLMKTYEKFEASEVFHLRAMSLARLYVEEAFYRLLLGAEEPMRKAALSSLMATMKVIEEGTLGEDKASASGARRLRRMRARLAPA